MRVVDLARLMFPRRLFFCTAGKELSVAAQRLTNHRPPVLQRRMETSGPVPFSPQPFFHVQLSTTTTTTTIIPDSLLPYQSELTLSFVILSLSLYATFATSTTRLNFPLSVSLPARLRHVADFSRTTGKHSAEKTSRLRRYTNRQFIHNRRNAQGSHGTMLGRICREPVWKI